ncbi:DUF1642 domain-containing protein [Lactococcus lactis]
MTKFEEKKKEAYEKASIKQFGNADGSRAMRYLLNELENAGLLKEQQALPVVPDFIGKLINTFGAPEDGKHINYSASYLENQKELDWIDNHQKTWLTALLIGFRVEKPQLFYLREKNTGYYLRKTGNNEYGITPHYSNDYDENYMHYKFTQQEIDSMQTGSYELVPVEDGE